MDERVPSLYISGIRLRPACAHRFMKPAAPLLMIPFREVRHDQPDDVLHYEPIKVRGKLHQWTIPTHRHEDLHQFQLLIRGGMSATLDGEQLELQAPLALMVTPGVVHGYTYQHNSVGYQVTLPSSALRSLLASSPALLPRLDQLLLVPAPELSEEDAMECEALFQNLGAEFERSRPGRAEALRSHAALLGLWFLRREAGTRAALRSEALRDALVQRYRSLLELHFRQHQPISFYATALKVTADHLSRVCRLTTGSSALDLAHERVLLEARRLLAYTPASVVEVAHELGFEDPAYFSRFFTKLAGQAPSTYRTAIAQGIALLPDQQGSA
jgi:AraC family transcriptional activator of pobA